MISAKQAALIHVAKKQLGLDEASYREVLSAYGGVSSARELDAEGFDRVMAGFNRLGFKSSWNARTFGDRRGMTTPRQIDMIRGLWREWSGKHDGAGLDHWLENRFGVTALRFLDLDGAHKAITALRSMKARKLAKAASEPMDDH
jgi:hypothetical protein